MAFAETVTKLSVDRLFAILGLHGFHGNQFLLPDTLDTDQSRRSPLGCERVIYQNRWQSAIGTPGREDIARAIREAEEMLEGKLHFPLGPAYFTQRLWTSGAWTQLDQRYFRQSGVRTNTLVEADAVVDPEDLDNDTFEESAVVAIDFSAFSATDQALVTAESIRLYYPVSLVGGDGAADAWEIRPVTIRNLNLVAGTAEAVFSMAQLLQPDLAVRPVPGAVDAADPTSYLDSVDVYWVRPTSAIASVLSGTCALCGGDSEAVDVTEAHIYVRDKVNSIMAASGVVCCAQPTLDYNYIAGWYDSGWNRLDPKYERAVVALTLASLGGICSCQHVSHLAEYYAEELVSQRSDSSGGGVGFSQSWQSVDRVKKNPLGFTRGAKIAWDIIVDDILGGTGNDYQPDVRIRAPVAWEV